MESLILIISARSGYSSTISPNTIPSPLNFFIQAENSSMGFAANSKRTFAVGNNQSFRIQSNILVIECCNPFARSRSSHVYGSGNLIGVKRVQRLTHVKHDEVCRVNYVSNRTLTQHRQTLLQPLRGWADFHIFNHTTDVAATIGRIFDIDLKRPSFA